MASSLDYGRSCCVELVMWLRTQLGLPSLGLSLGGQPDKIDTHDKWDNLGKLVRSASQELALREPTT